MAASLMRSPWKNVKDGSFPNHMKIYHTLLSTTGLIGYLRNEDFVGVGLLPALSHRRSRRRTIVPVFDCSKLPPQSEETLVEDFNGTSSSSSDHVQVRFQLQRECVFGEGFHIVGDDPVLGSWDPSSSIPMDWSENHVWTVGLGNIPVGKKIQFKFILKDGGAKSSISWQPGPDRILHTWKTAKIIVVCEDWNDAELQAIFEEDVACETEIINGDSISRDEQVAEQDLTLIRHDLDCGEDDILDPSECSPVLLPGLNPTDEEDEDEEDTIKDQDEANGSSNQITETNPLMKPIFHGEEDEDEEEEEDIVTVFQKQDTNQRTLLQNFILGCQILRKILCGFRFLR